MDDQRRQDGTEAYGEDDSAVFDEYSEYSGYDVSQELLNEDLYPSQAYDDPDSAASATDEKRKKKKRKKKTRKKRLRKRDPARRRRSIDRRIKRKKMRKKARRVILTVLGVLALLGVGFYLFFSSSVFLVSEIAVNHNTLKSDRQIINESGLRIGENIFKFRSGEVKQAILKNNPYIFDVKISRKLPNRVTLTVDEHTPVVAIKYKGKYLILDAGGKVVGIEDTQITATRLTGVEVTKYKIGDVPVVSNSSMLKESLKLIVKVNNSDLFFKKLDVSSSFTVHGYITDELECAGEPDDIIENLEGIKAIIYDLSQKNIMKGTIFVGKEGYATFSPVSSGHSSAESDDRKDTSGSKSSSDSSDSAKSTTKAS